MKKGLVGALLLLTASQAWSMTNFSDIKKEIWIISKKFCNTSVGNIDIEKMLHFQKPAQNEGFIQAGTIIVDEDFTGYGVCRAITEIKIGNGCTEFTCGLLHTPKLSISNPKTYIKLFPKSAIGELYKNNVYMGSIYSWLRATGETYGGIVVEDYKNCTSTKFEADVIPTYRFEGTWDELCDALSNGIMQADSLQEFLGYLEHHLTSLNKPKKKSILFSCLPFLYSKK